MKETMLTQLLYTGHVTQEQHKL